MIVTVPFATAVTSPADDTVTNAVFDDDQVTAASDNTFPPASFTVVPTVMVSPTDDKVIVLGDSSMVDGWVTVTVAVALIEPEDAMIVVVPSPTEVTRPADETVATSVALESHVTVTPGMADPNASFTVATSVAVAPSDSKESEVGDSSMLDRTWDTVTVAVVLTEPETAMIVVVPLPTEVTRPPAETVATPVVVEAHVTVPTTADPAASLTVATNVAVSATDVNVSSVSDNSMLVAV